MQLKFSHWRWQKVLLTILIFEIVLAGGIWLWDNPVLGTVLNKALKISAGNLLTAVNQIPSPSPTLNQLLGSNSGQTFYPPKFTIIAGGTVVLSRGVAERINKYQDPTYPWQKIAAEFKNADLAIVNFKGPLTSSCLYERETVTFCGQPRFIQGLTFAGIDIVSLAGNHIGDYGSEGILETIKILDENGILHAGVGRNLSEAHQTAVFEIPSLIFQSPKFPPPQLSIPPTLHPSSSPSIKIGFLAYNSVPTKTPIADSDSPGIDWLTAENLERDIKALRPQVDILIVMPNWGEEYTHEPSEFQIEMGHKMVDLGADLVLGDQAHWIQKIERRQDKYIFYGLGNLVFDQMWSQKTREGLVVRFNFERTDLKSFDLMPVVIEDYAQPRWANEAEKKRILKDIGW